VVILPVVMFFLAI